MKIKYYSDYLSIKKFNDVELPNFVVLTGVNGSGKSHLLNAIKENLVQIQDVQHTEVVFFDYETFKLDKEQVSNTQLITDNKEKAWGALKQMQKNISNWRQYLGSSYSSIVNECKVNKISFLASDAPALEQYKLRFNKNFSLKEDKDNGRSASIYLVAQKIPYSIDEITEKEFKRLYKPFQFKNDFLPRQLGQVFWDYHYKYEMNKYDLYRNKVENANYSVLSDEDFVLENGEKPWDMINSLLASMNTFRYQINSPEKKGVYTSYLVKLIDNSSSGLEVDFENLSSGERVLMALVCCIYKSSADNHFPKALLLDEIDASLHPSMIKYLIKVVEDVFLAKNMRVILVTHSPTTIALSPDESIFLMQKNGLDRIVKTTKKEALDLLTEGFVTLDRGLSIFDELVGNKLTLITEGNNISYINKLLELHDISGVKVLLDIKSSSGKNQLNTLYDFFAKVPHDNKLLFVWDSDVTLCKTQINNTYPFILPKNEANTLAKKGIENMFSEELVRKYATSRVKHSGEIKGAVFESEEKREFEIEIMRRNKLEDFSLFESLINKIQEIINDD